MKSKMILFLVSFVMSLSACRNEDEPTLPVYGSRTVLTYTIAQNFSSPLARLDMEGMIKGVRQVDATSNNLLVCIDNYSAPRLVRLGKNSKGQVVEEVVVNYPEQSSTDVAAMKKAISIVFNTYKAESYGTGFWLHGEGWIPSLAKTRWFEQDGNDYMNVDDLHEASQVAPKLDFLLFDACFVELVEVAYALRDCGDCMTSSPIEIPGVGAPYEDVTPAVLTAENPTMKIVSVYYIYYENRYNDGVGLANGNWTDGVSVGVVKMSELENLAVAIAEIPPKYVTGKADFNLSGAMCYDRRYLALYHDLDQYIYKLTVGNGDYDTRKVALDKVMAYWKSTPRNYSAYVGMLAMDSRVKGLSTYTSMTNRESINTSYRDTGWYKASGRADTGWYK